MIQAARVEVPNLGKMKKAHSFQQLQKNLNNDTVWNCLDLFHTLAGIWIYPSDPDVERHWPAFSQMVSAISEVAQLLNYAFAYLEVTFRDDGRRSNLKTRQLREWFDLQAGYSGNRFTTSLTVSVLGEIETRTRIASEVTPHLHVFDVFIVHIGGEEEVYDPPETDVFISYKHATYFDLASKLYDVLQKKGVACWLDREKLGLREGQWVDPKVLRTKLKKALQAARCTVFFETYSLATADTDFRGESLVYNWQEFEHRFANNLLIVRPRQGTVFESASSSSGTFTGLEDLAEVIGRQLPGYRRRTPVARYVRDEGETLKDCLALLAELGNTYFGREVTISPRAALILVAPGGMQLREERVFSNDLLINLVRYSPYCAVEMMKAGLDILSLMRVGIKLRNTDWNRPSSWLFEDFLASSAIDRVEIINEIERIGYLDETSLLRFACLGETFATDLLTKTLNLMQGKPANEPATAEIEVLKERVIRSLRERNYRYRDQQWAIDRDGDRLHLRPVACCGIFNITGLTSDDPVSARLHVAQTNSLFSRPAFKAFEDLLNSEPTAEILEAFLEASDEVQATVSASSPMYAADLLEMTGSNGTRAHFLLEPVVPIQLLEGDGMSLSLGAKLHDAVCHLRSQVKTIQATQDQMPFSFSYRRHAIIVGTPIEGESVEETPSISLVDLQINVLSNLWQYQQARNLEYDDI